MLLPRQIAAAVLFLWPSLPGDFGLWAQVPGRPGDVGIYRYPAGDLVPSSLVTRLELRWGSKHSDAQWSRLDAYKADGRRFRVWLLTRRSPSRTAGQEESPIQRYLLQEGNEKAVEYQNQFTGNAVLPSHGFWSHQQPKAQDPAQSSFVFPKKVFFLGHTLDLESIGIEDGRSRSAGWRSRPSATARPAAPSAGSSATSTRTTGRGRSASPTRTTPCPSTSARS